MVAFIDPDGVSDFDDIMMRNKPDFVLAIGEPFSEQQRREIQSAHAADQFPYSTTYIVPKQLCLLDRTTGDDSRAVLILYRRGRPALTPAQVVELCGAENLGTCASMSDAAHATLRQQRFELNSTHDPKGQFACPNPLCHGCRYTP